MNTHDATLAALTATRACGEGVSRRSRSARYP